MDLRRGGKAAIERMLEAYGVSTKQALCEHLGISSSTLANRYLRDTFPADYVIQCCLETGVSLRWLVFGDGDKHLEFQNKTVSIPAYRIIDGEVVSDGLLEIDKRIIPENILHPKAYFDSEITYITHDSSGNLIDGEWVINLNGQYSIRKIFQLPNRKIKISNDYIDFETDISDITLVSKILLTIR